MVLRGAGPGRHAAAIGGPLPERRRSCGAAAARVVHWPAAWRLVDSQVAPAGTPDETPGHDTIGARVLRPRAGRAAPREGAVPWERVGGAS